MADSSMIEQFSAAELKRLRNNLMHSCVDSRQLAQMVTAFLSSHGYGVKKELVSEVILPIDRSCSSIERMQDALACVAFVM